MRNTWEIHVILCHLSESKNTWACFLKYMRNTWEIGFILRISCIAHVFLMYSTCKSHVFFLCSYFLNPNRSLNTWEIHVKYMNKYMRNTWIHMYVTCISHVSETYLMYISCISHAMHMYYSCIILHFSCI